MRGSSFLRFGQDRLLTQDVVKEVLHLGRRIDIHIPSQDGTEELLPIRNRPFDLHCQLLPLLLIHQNAAVHCPEDGPEKFLLEGFDLLHSELVDYF